MTTSTPSSRGTVPVGTPINVAYCIDSFNIGGTELNAIKCAEALDPARFRLAVFHFHADGPLRVRYEALRIPMVHLPIRNLYSWSTAVQGRRMTRQLRAWRSDVIHTHDLYTNIFAAPLARVFGRCKVIASRRWWYDAPRPGLVRANRWSYRFAHRVLANSTAVANLLHDDEGVAREKICEIPNLIGEGAFAAVAADERLAQRRAWGLPDSAFVIGSIGRLAAVKNLQLILRAVVLLPSDVHVLLIGGGAERYALEQLARDLGIASRVHLVGEIVNVRNLPRMFDLSVLSSTSEGFPNSVIEAMAAARPVVATRVGGVPDVVVDGETGLLVPSEDVTAVARAIETVRADPAFAAKLGAAGQAAVRARFHERVVIDQLAGLYEALGRMPATGAVRTGERD